LSFVLLTFAGVGGLTYWWYARGMEHAGEYRTIKKGEKRGEEQVLPEELRNEYVRRYFLLRLRFRKSEGSSIATKRLRLLKNNQLFAL